jgi:hypothetical protein
MTEGRGRDAGAKRIVHGAWREESVRRKKSGIADFRMRIADWPSGDGSYKMIPNAQELLPSHFYIILPDFFIL